MKTTINISDSLFQEIKTLAKENQTTYKDIIEAALRLFIGSRTKKAKTFMLKSHTFKGEGLQDGLTEGNWSEIREKIYAGRGG